MLDLGEAEADHIGTLCLIQAGLKPINALLRRLTLIKARWPRLLSIRSSLKVARDTLRLARFPLRHSLTFGSPFSTEVLFGLASALA